MRREIYLNLLSTPTIFSYLETSKVWSFEFLGKFIMRNPTDQKT